jgi:hypothetical protein
VLEKKPCWWIMKPDGRILDSGGGGGSKLFILHTRRRPAQQRLRSGSFLYVVKEKNTDMVVLPARPTCLTLVCLPYRCSATG